MEREEEMNMSRIYSAILLESYVMMQWTVVLWSHLIAGDNQETWNDGCLHFHDGHDDDAFFALLE